LYHSNYLLKINWDLCDFDALQLLVLIFLLTLDQACSPIIISAIKKANEKSGVQLKNPEEI